MQSLYRQNKDFTELCFAKIRFFSKYYQLPYGNFAHYRQLLKNTTVKENVFEMRNIKIDITLEAIQLLQTGDGFAKAN